MRLTRPGAHAASTAAPPKASPCARRAAATSGTDPGSATASAMAAPLRPRSRTAPGSAPPAAGLELAALRGPSRPTQPLPTGRARPWEPLFARVLFYRRGESHTYTQPCVYLRRCQYLGRVSTYIYTHIPTPTPAVP